MAGTPRQRRRGGKGARITTSPPIILVDTNVWVDNYLPGRPSAQASRRFIREAYERGAQLAYPAHCVKDVFFLIRLGLKRLARERDAAGELSENDATAIRAIAWGCIDNMRDLACAIGADESDVWTACKQRSLTNDLEDNLVIAAALRSKASLLVTSGDALLKHSPIPSLSPADAFMWISSGA